MDMNNSGYMTITLPGGMVFDVLFNDEDSREWAWNEAVEYIEDGATVVVHSFGDFAYSLIWDLQTHGFDILSVDNGLVTFARDGNRYIADEYDIAALLMALDKMAVR